MSSEKRDVVVIGAGISGLVCAYRLRSRGLDVALIESSERPGGVIQSDPVNGYLIERGPNTTRGTTELLSLVEELGIPGELAEGDPKSPAYVYFEGKLHRVPMGPGQLIVSRLLSPAGKLRLLAEPFVRPADGVIEESVGSFARRRLGSQVAERLVAPFVSGIFAGDAEALSVQAAFPHLAEIERTQGSIVRGLIAEAREARRGGDPRKPKPKTKRLVSFRRGMESLPRALAGKLGPALFLGCAGIKLSPRETGFESSYERYGARDSITSHKVVIATPAWVAGSLVRPLSEEAGRLLGEIEYPPLAVAYLAYPSASIDALLEGFGFLVAPSETRALLGSVFNSVLFEDRAPIGQTLLTCFVGGARNPSAARLEDEKLISVVHSELAPILKIREKPEVVAITRYERSIPQYALGHMERIRRIDEILGTIPGLRLAGNYLNGVSVGDCIKNAELIAHEIAQRTPS